jgi:N-ethylmaleimide reductase
MLNGGLTKETGEKALADGAADMIAYGVPFIANPDLVHRFQTNAELAAPDFRLFYVGGDEGYIDYPSLGKQNDSKT